MFQRFMNRFKFIIERYMIRGPWHRLLVIAVVIGIISLAAGLFVFYEIGGFKLPSDAVWWAFLRLTDTGYLGDDEGAWLRTVSTLLTVFGAVIFLGALIAIMTQWLNETINRLHSGLTPIAQNNHIVILGWTHRTPMIIQELLLSEGRLKHFLRRRGARQRIRIVILAERVTPATIQELKERLGSLWSPRRIIFRTGSPLRVEHLHRVDFLHAAAILLPARELTTDTLETPDAQAIKVLLSLSNSSQEMEHDEKPRIVAEMFDARKAALAHRAYSGPMELLASDLLISRLMAQTVRHPGLSSIYSELLAHTEGNEVYTRICPECEGLPWHRLPDLFPASIPIGIARRDDASYQTVLNPANDTLLQPDDRVVFIAPDYEATKPELRNHEGAGRGSVRMQKQPEISDPPLVTRRVLILGWNRKVPVLLNEFESYLHERFEVDIFSLVPVREREQAITQFEIQTELTQIHHHEGDYTSLFDLKRIHPEQYQHILFMANDWVESEAESDARTMLGHLVLYELLVEQDSRPRVLVELMDHSNAIHLQQHEYEVLITPVILSHILTHITLRRELRSVFDALFGAAGPEIHIKPVDGYVILGQEMSFADIQRSVGLQGEIALGLKINADEEGVILNPDREQKWTLSPKDEIVILTNQVSADG